MMKIYLSLLFLFIGLNAFAQEKDSLKIVSDSLKNKVIKYHINKVIGGGKEIEAKRTEITISLERINIYSEAGGRVTDATAVIQSKEWNFNADLSKGFASYKGYIKDEDGNTTDINLTIEADADGKLKLYDPTGDPNGSLIMYADTWTITK